MPDWQRPLGARSIMRVSAIGIDSNNRQVFRDQIFPAKSFPDPLLHFVFGGPAVSRPAANFLEGCLGYSVDGLTCRIMRRGGEAARTGDSQANTGQWVDIVRHVADVLAAFGWRESRPDPRSTRDHDPNVLQPATLANGTISNRLTRLSDEHAFTALALEEQPVARLVERLFLRLLSRQPTAGEVAKFSAILEPSFANRRTGAPSAPARPAVTKAVSWANHLNPDATRTVLAIEQEVKAGPTPTPQLASDWRDCMEDAIWALMLSPEFTYLP